MILRESFWKVKSKVDVLANGDRAKEEYADLTKAEGSLASLQRFLEERGETFRDNALPAGRAIHLIKGAEEIVSAYYASHNPEGSQGCPCKTCVLVRESAFQTAVEG